MLARYYIINLLLKFFDVFYIFENSDRLHSAARMAIDEYFVVQRDSCYLLSP